MRPVIVSKPHEILSTSNPRAISARWVVSVLAFAAMTALGAQVRVPVPWTDVPMTLQSFAVLLAGLMLAPRAAVSAMVIYLVCGIAGLPVFAPHSAGLYGATGGYLVGFVLSALTISLVRGQSSGAGRLVGAGLAGLVVLFGCGLAWRWVYATIIDLDAGPLLAAGVVPFIPKAIVELLLAVSVTKMVGVARTEVRGSFLK